MLMTIINRTILTGAPIRLEVESTTSPAAITTHITTGVDEPNLEIPSLDQDRRDIASTRFTGRQ
jgi:hypothetical protein